MHKTFKDPQCVGTWSFTHHYFNTENILHLTQREELIPLANWIPSFLGIPRNSQKIPIKHWFEKLGITGNFWEGRLQFNEDLELFGIPRNSQLYITLTTHNLRKVEFLGISGSLRQFKCPEVQVNSKNISIPWMWRF